MKEFTHLIIQNSIIKMEISENGFIFSDKKELLDPEAIHYYLSVESYWAKGIPLDTVKRSIENSLCFGIYKDQEQVGLIN